MEILDEWNFVGSLDPIVFRQEFLVTEQYKIEKLLPKYASAFCKATAEAVDNRIFIRVYLNDDVSEGLLTSPLGIVDKASMMFKEYMDLNVRIMNTTYYSPQFYLGQYRLSSSLLQPYFTEEQLLDIFDIHTDHKTKCVYSGLF